MLNAEEDLTEDLKLIDNTEVAYKAAEPTNVSPPPSENTPNGAVADVQETQIGDLDAANDPKAAIGEEAAPIELDAIALELNQLSAEEIISLYASTLTSVSQKAYEMVNAEAIENIEKALKTYQAEYGAQKHLLSAEQQNAYLEKIVDLQDKMKLYHDRQKHLEKVSGISDVKQQKAAEILAKIWKIKNIEVNPMWALAIILLAPVLNVAMVTFGDKYKYKI